MALVDRNRFRKTYTSLKRARRYIKTYPDVLDTPDIGPAPFSESISASAETTQESLSFLATPMFFAKVFTFSDVAFHA